MGDGRVVLPAGSPRLMLHYGILEQMLVSKTSNTYMGQITVAETMLPKLHRLAEEQLRAWEKVGVV